MVLVGEHFTIFPKFPFHLCSYLHNSLENYLDYHILDILGHGSKCLDIMGLDILGLDILGIIHHEFALSNQRHIARRQVQVKNVMINW